jgi:hypothetical protein
VKKSKEGKNYEYKYAKECCKMEQVCNICRHSEEENLNKPDTTVLLICEDCLKSEMLPPFLDKIFLD